VLRVRLVEFVQEDDSDIHLVVADPRSGAKTFVESAADYCTLTTKPALSAKLRTARAALVRARGPARPRLSGPGTRGHGPGLTLVALGSG
jgi:hypothetical protein